MAKFYSLKARKLLSFLTFFIMAVRNGYGPRKYILYLEILDEFSILVNLKGKDF